MVRANYSNYNVVGATKKTAGGRRNKESGWMKHIDIDPTTQIQALLVFKNIFTFSCGTCDPFTK